LLVVTAAPAKAVVGIEAKLKSVSVPTTLRYKGCNEYNTSLWLQRTSGWLLVRLAHWLGGIPTTAKMVAGLNG
jgi:hypothetical protein